MTDEYFTNLFRPLAYFVAGFAFSEVLWIMQILGALGG